MSRTLLAAAAAVTLHVTVAHAAGPSIDEHVSPAGTRFVLATVPEANDLAIQVVWPTDWAMDRDINHAAPVMATATQFASGAEGYDPGTLNVLFEDTDAAASLRVDSQFVYGSMELPRRGAEDVLTAINAHLRAPGSKRRGFAAIGTRSGNLWPRSGKGLRRSHTTPYTGQHSVIIPSGHQPSFETWMQQGGWNGPT